MWGTSELYCPDCETELDNVYRDGIIYHVCPDCGYEVKNEYSEGIKLWKNYLMVIDSILKAKEIANIPVFEDQRQEAHNALIEFYEKRKKNFNREWFDDVCHNLEKYIDLNDDIYYNAKALANFMYRQRL